MTRTVFALALLTTLAAAQPQTREAAPGDTRGRLARAIKIIPVPQLVAALPSPRRLPFGTMIECAPGSDDSTQRSLVHGDDEGPGPISDLAALVRDLTPLSWNDGNVTADLVGNALMVTGSPDQIHLVEQSLQRLTACLGEPFRVRAAAFTAESAIDVPTVASSFNEARTKLLDLGAKFLWEQNTTATSGQVVELGSLTSTAYVGDFDVEIAQSMAMVNPVMRSVHVGAAVHVQAHPLVGSSDVVVLAQYASGESVTALREASLGKDPSMSKLQVPTVALDTGTLSGRIRNGGALVLLADGKWGGRSFGLILGVERTPVPAEAERDLGLFQLGAFLSHSLRWQFNVADDIENRGRWTPPLATTDEAPALDPAQTETWSTLFQHALGDDQAGVSIDRRLALVRGTGAANARATVSRLIELLQEQFFKTVEVECRLDAVDATQGGVVQRLRFPALLGRSHALVHGVESSGVVDSDVEVAQKSGISDPKVARHFTGVDCQVTGYSLSGAELGVAANLHFTDTVAGRVYMPDNRQGVPIEEPQIARASFAHAGKVPGDGKPIEFGNGPAVQLGDRTIRTLSRLSVRLR